MSRLLIDPALPEGAKFIGASELAFSLHIKALCYCARALTDGFVPTSKVYGLVHASKAAVDIAIKHLTTTQPGCANPSWEIRPGGWYLHDYDDPQYMNPMRAEVQELTQKRRIAASKGGLKSVETRLLRYGTTQPISSQAESLGVSAATQAEPVSDSSGARGEGKSLKRAQSYAQPRQANPPATQDREFQGPSGGGASSRPEANAEPTPEVLASTLSEPLASGFASTEPAAAPKQTSKHPSRSQSNLPAPQYTYTDVPGDYKNVSSTSGDDVVHEQGNGVVGAWGRVSPATLIGHVGAWFLHWKGWHEVKGPTHTDLQADAKAIVGLGIPGDELHAFLDELAGRHDPDDVNRLSYFWQPIQDLQTESRKTSARSQTRSSGLSRLSPSIPERKS